MIRLTPDNVMHAGADYIREHHPAHDLADDLEPLDAWVHRLVDDLADRQVHQLWRQLGSPWDLRGVRDATGDDLRAVVRTELDLVIMDCLAAA